MVNARKRMVGVLSLGIVASNTVVNGGDPNAQAPSS